MLLSRAEEVDFNRVTYFNYLGPYYKVEQAKIKKSITTTYFVHPPISWKEKRQWSDFQILKSDPRWSFTIFESEIAHFQFWSMGIMKMNKCNFMQENYWKIHWEMKFVSLPLLIFYTSVFVYFPPGSSNSWLSPQD